MDLVKQYIVQCINTAANNLRLNSEKIEVVAHLREFIIEAENLEEEIKEMKKVTELSTFAIKLNEIYRYISKSKIDFLKISDRFKEHSHSLVKELGYLLDRVNPDYYLQIESKLKCENNFENEVQNNSNEENLKEKAVAENINIVVNVDKNEKKSEEKISTEKLKEEIILDVEEKETDFSFENFESKILNPIKELEQFLTQLVERKHSSEDLEKFQRTMEKNARCSEAVGFEIISNMHLIFAHSLNLIKQEKLDPVKEVIACMRACLIVIVAVIKGKEVDITNYLNKAERFGEYIMEIK